MKDTLYRQLATTIHECRTWVDVLDTDREGNFMLRSGGDLHPFRCRVLSLIAKIHHGVYPKGHVWDIPEYRLDRAVNSLKRRPGFKERCKSGTLSMQDAEDIIRLASHKLINLELEL